MCAVNQYVVEAFFYIKECTKLHGVAGCKTQNQIDHFSVSKKFRLSFHAVKVFRGAGTYYLDIIYDIVVFVLPFGVHVNICLFLLYYSYLL